MEPVKKPVALLMLDGALADFNFATRVRGMSEPFSCQFLLPPIPNVAYSACLMHQVELMIESVESIYDEGAASVRPSEVAFG